MKDEQVDVYLEVLGLQRGASYDDVRKAYRELVLVWHPDRFPKHASLRAKASERTARIVEAYRWLIAHPDAWFEQPSADSNADAESNPPPPSGGGPRHPRDAQDTSKVEHHSGWWKRLLVPALVLAVGLVFLGRLQATDESGATTPRTPETSSAARALTLPSQESLASPRGQSARQRVTEVGEPRWVSVDQEDWGDFVVVTKRDREYDPDWHGAGYNPFRNVVVDSSGETVAHIHGSYSLEDFTGDGRRELIARDHPSTGRCCFLIEVFALRDGTVRELFSVGGYASVELTDLDGDGDDEIVTDNVLNIQGIGLCCQPELPVALRWDGIRLENVTVQLDRERIDERLEFYKLEVIAHPTGEVSDQDLRSAAAGVLGAGLMLGSDRLLEAKAWLNEHASSDVVAWVAANEDEIFRQALRTIHN